MFKIKGCNKISLDFDFNASLPTFSDLNETFPHLEEGF